MTRRRNLLYALFAVSLTTGVATLPLLTPHATIAAADMPREPGAASAAAPMLASLYRHELHRSLASSPPAEVPVDGMGDTDGNNGGGGGGGSDAAPARGNAGPASRGGAASRTSGGNGSFGSALGTFPGGGFAGGGGGGGDSGTGEKGPTDDESDEGSQVPDILPPNAGEDDDLPVPPLTPPPTPLPEDLVDVGTDPLPPRLVSEPSTLALLLAGAVGLALARRRQRS